MSKLVAIAALNLSHVLRLWALIRAVTFLLAVTTSYLPGFRAVSGRMALLSTIVTAARSATVTSALGTVS